MNGFSAGAVYLWYALAFTLLVTFLSGRSLSRRTDDLRGWVGYFVVCFVLLLAVPLVLTIVDGADVLGQLRSIGLTTGRAGRGMLILLGAVPVVALAGWLGSRDPEMAPLMKRSRTWTSCDRC